MEVGINVSFVKFFFLRWGWGSHVPRTSFQVPILFPRLLRPAPRRKWSVEDVKVSYEEREEDKEKLVFTRKVVCHENLFCTLIQEMMPSETERKIINLIASS